jgi:hypothetical protein
MFNNDMFYQASLMVGVVGICIAFLFIYSILKITIHSHTKDVVLMKMTGIGKIGVVMPLIIQVY